MSGANRSLLGHFHGDHYGLTKSRCTEASMRAETCSAIRSGPVLYWLWWKKLQGPVMKKLQRRITSTVRKKLSWWNLLITDENKSESSKPAKQIRPTYQNKTKLLTQSCLLRLNHKRFEEITESLMMTQNKSSIFLVDKSYKTNPISKTRLCQRRNISVPFVVLHLKQTVWT